MKIAFNGLGTSIPDGWRDESTLTFVMAQDPALSMPLSMNKKSSRASASITIAWDETDKDVQAYLDDRVETLARALPGFQERERGDVEPGLPYIEYAIDGPMPMIQLLMIKRLEGRVVTVTGTALTAAYDGVRPQFLKAARDLQAG